MVRHYAPLAVMVVAFFTVILSLFGEDSYSRLQNLRRAVIRQDEDNSKTQIKVAELKENVSSLRNDPRALEKAARNELGLARPNEQIFIFEQKKREQRRS